jgi:hypothetical protein
VAEGDVRMTNSGYCHPHAYSFRRLTMAAQASAFTTWTTPAAAWADSPNGATCKELAAAI